MVYYIPIIYLVYNIYIFARNLTFGEEKIQSALHIFISMDSIEGWKIFEKKKYMKFQRTKLEFATYLQLFTYHLHYIWASLAAQTVNNLPAMQKTQVQTMGWEDPLEKEMVTHFSILAFRIP